MDSIQCADCRKFFLAVMVYIRASTFQNDPDAVPPGTSAGLGDSRAQTGLDAWTPMIALIDSSPIPFKLITGFQLPQRRNTGLPTGAAHFT